MRRFLMLLLIAFGVFVLTPAAGGVPDQNLVAGTGQRMTLSGLPLTVHLDAQSGPAGEDAHGTFRTVLGLPDVGPVTARGRISCLTVEGNKAAARGPVEESTDPGMPVGSELLIEVADNGSPGSFADTNLNIFGLAPGEFPVVRSSRSASRSPRATSSSTTDRDSPVRRAVV